MYPVVPINARVVTDKDVTIGGYQFPKNVGLLFLAIFIFVVKPSKKNVYCYKFKRLCI